VADGLNKVMLLGNLGADPELRVTQSGQSVLKLRLATSATYLDKDRVRQERVEWHSVIVWGKRSEALSRFLLKGSRLFVEGELRTSSYDPADGGPKRYRTEVNASNIILAGGGQRRDNSNRDNDEPANRELPAGDDEAYSDDIPF
jgi:single-strand DNA-binding protein